MSTSSPEPTYVYKIMPAPPPDPIPEELPISPLDANDGFIHLSTAPQVPKTAGRFFKDQSTLWILKMKVSVLNSGKGELIWEASQGHGVFPHLYNSKLGSREVEELLVFEKKEGQVWDEILSALEQ